MVLLGCTLFTLITFGTAVIFIALVAQDFEPAKPANNELENYLVKTRG